MALKSNPARFFFSSSSSPCTSTSIYVIKMATGINMKVKEYMDLNADIFMDALFKVQKFFVFRCE